MEQNRIMTNNYVVDLKNIEKNYPGLTYDDNIKALKGNISIHKICNDEIINETYDILIDFKSCEIPQVYELGKKIKRSYEHKYSDNRLCLATDIEQILFLKKHKMISHWIKNYVESYFISYEFFQRYGVYPFGQYSHGKKGILEFYESYFNLEAEKNSVEILRYIFLKKYRGHDLCPCGSDLKVRNCHKDTILKCKSDSNIDLLSTYFRGNIDEKKK